MRREQRLAAVTRPLETEWIDSLIGEHHQEGLKQQEMEWNSNLPSLWEGLKWRRGEE